MIKKFAKKILVALPFKKPIFTFFRNIFHPGEAVYRHLYFKGPFKVKVDSTHSFKMNHYGYQLENEVFWEGLTGRWEKESMGLWIKLCKQSNVIFDVGANTGIYSLVAQTVNPRAQVFAFEPVNTIYSKLIDNNKLNNYTINCFDQALSNSKGKMAMHKVNSEHTYEATLNKVFENALPDAKAMTVDVTTVKSFIEENGIHKIDLMKIDVETHEPEVLQGFEEYLSKYKPVILIELITDYVVNDVIPVIKDLGYLYFNIDEKKGIRQVDKLVLSDSYNFLFCTQEQATQYQLI